MPVSNTEITPNKAADITIGVILSLCTIIGLPCNILAFIHFTRRFSRNINSRFFTRLYSVISLIDCLICVIQFPIIQALFGGRDSDALLFKDFVFCNTWTVLIMTFIMLSVFLVLMLSVSRLLLIRFPHIQMRLSLPVVCPTIYSAIVVMGLFVVPITMGYIAITYNPNKAVCTTYGAVPEFDYQNITNDTMMTIELLEAEMAIKIAWSCVMALPVLPILVTFCLSLFYLKQGKARAAVTHSAVKRHTDASITVMIFTLVYVICNFPMLVYLAHVKSEISAQMSSVEMGLPYMEEHDKIYEKLSDFARYYAWMVVFDLPTSINSAINPIIYYWRMEPFRSFVRTGIQDITLQSNSVDRTEPPGELTRTTEETHKSPVDIFRRIRCTFTDNMGRRRSQNIDAIKVQDDVGKRQPPIDTNCIERIEEDNSCRERGSQDIFSINMDIQRKSDTDKHELS